MRYLFIVSLFLFPVGVLGQSAATGPLDPLEFARLKSYGAYRSGSNNLYVDSNDDCKHPIPGEEFVLADLQGPGIVNHIWVTIADSEYAWPRLLRVRVYYDGHKTPSVDVPLGDFFGVGHGYERNLNSLMVRNSSFGRARNSYWPMPFKKSCKITLTDEGSRRVTSLYYHVDWQKHGSLPADVGYFHGYYRQGAPPPAGKLYTLLNIRGAGHYVGSVLNIIQTQMGWFGEGDEMFYVDGEPTPRIEGTGTEDYFNDAWALRVSDGAWTGIPVAEGEGYGARLTGFRWHGVDPVPFKESLRVAIEHFGWTYNADGRARSGFEERSDFFSSVAFWYQKGVNEDLSEPPYGAARLPLGNAEQIEVENHLKDVKTTKGEASVEKEVFWSKDILLLKAEGPDSEIRIPFEVPRDGFYEVIAQLAQSPDYGDYVATLDGKQTNSMLVTWGPLETQAPPLEIIHNYEPEIFVGVDHRLGWFKLGKGRHEVAFRCVGKDKLATGYNLGVDGIILAEIENGEALVKATGEGLPRYEVVEDLVAARAPAQGVVYRGQPLAYYLNELKQAKPEARTELIRAIGAFGADAAPAVEALIAALADPKAEVRAAAARALTNVGPGASKAAPTVAKLLKDENVRVRESATLSLRAMGKGAAAAVPELIAALKDPAATVRMSAALALGAIGPSASPAVPAMQEAILAVNGPDLSADNIQVVRNICYSLGDIGLDAQRAIPVLKQVQHLRIKYIAEEAIAKIQGNPKAKWH